MQSKEYKQAIRMARTFSTNMFKPQDKAVWHHLKVAEHSDFKEMS